jgi:hypothetical protein
MIKEVEREIEDGKEIIKDFEDASAKLNDHARKLYFKIKRGLIKKYSKYNDSENIDNIDKEEVFRELTDEILDIIQKIGNEDLIMKMANIAFNDFDENIYEHSEIDDIDNHEITCFGHFHLDDLGDSFLRHGPNYVYDYAELLLLKLLRYQVMSTMDIFEDFC